MFGFCTKKQWTYLMGCLTIFKSLDNPGKNKDNFTRKLSIVHDPECKERIIGIFDYGSQMVLKPLSDHIFKILSSIKSDRTYTQNPYFSHTEIDKNQKFNSLDLSSATDRFPIDFQVRVLSLILDQKKSEA
jgi:hypothetical protein